MFFALLLGFSALFVASCAAYFSVLGIAGLFAGSFWPVVVMASSLELGKLVATSYLYRYWQKTTLLLKVYLVIAVLILMFVTSLGIFGFLSAAYQVNSTKFAQVDQQIALIEEQKKIFSHEVEQNNKRLQVLNDIRAVQEKRVEEAGNYKTPREQAYAAIEKANAELKNLMQRNQEIQKEISTTDLQILELKYQFNETKDIGTFKFVSQTINKPLDKVVIGFICVLIAVFDPLAVALILAFNVVTTGRIIKGAKEFATTATSVAGDNNLNKQERVIGLNISSSK
jgi:hypothetical protein